MNLALFPGLVGRKNRLWQSLMSISKVLVAINPAHKGLASSPQCSFLAIDFATSLEMRVSYPTAPCKPTMTSREEMSLRVSLSVCTEST